MKTLAIIIIILLVVLLLGCLSKKPTEIVTEDGRLLKDVSVELADELIQNNKNNPDFIILDVRTQKEYDEGHLENAIIIDFYQKSFRQQLDELNKEKTYLIYCRTGRRSGEALLIMNELEFQKVYNMAGGITEWKNKGYQI